MLKNLFIFICVNSILFDYCAAPRAKKRHRRWDARGISTQPSLPSIELERFELSTLRAETFFSNGHFFKLRDDAGRTSKHYSFCFFRKPEAPDKEVVIHELIERQVIRLAKSRMYITSKAFAYTQPICAVATIDGRITLWDINEQRQLKDFSFGSRNGAISHVDFSQDDKFLIVCTGEGAIKIWDIEEGELLFNISGGIPVSLGFYKVKSSPCGNYLVCADFNKNEVCVWELATSRKVFARGLPNPICDLHLLQPDGHVVVEVLKRNDYSPAGTDFFKVVFDEPEVV